MSCQAAQVQRWQKDWRPKDTRWHLSSGIGANSLVNGGQPEDVGLPGFSIVAALDIQLWPSYESALSAVSHARHLPEQTVPAGRPGWGM